MRIFWKFKRLACDFLAGILCCLFALGFLVFAAEKFPLMQGERVYYLYSSSSQGVRKEIISLGEIAQIKGESVRIALEKSELQAFLKSYDSKVVKTEKVGEIISYYAYTPKLSSGVFIEGEKVNLHIAYNQNAGAAIVGSPIIFGGY